MQLNMLAGLECNDELNKIFQHKSSENKCTGLFAFRIIIRSVHRSK